MNECKQCGYLYQKEDDGRHSCSKVLKDKLIRLKSEVQEIINKSKEVIKEL